MKVSCRAVSAMVVALYAAFSAATTILPPEEDYLWVYSNGDMAMPIGQSVDQDAGCYFEVGSGSPVSVSVTGLPTGVAFNASSCTFSGAPSKAGIYYVSVSAQNENGYRHSVVMRWTVGDASSGDYDDIDGESGWLDCLDDLWTGQYFEWHFPVGTLCCGISYQYSISSIAGIPDGLKWDSSTGMLSGIPTKSGKYVLTFTDSTKKKAVKTIVVMDSGSAYFAASVADDCFGLGTVAGGGVYPAGQTVEFVATPTSNCAFAGWYRDGGMVDSSARHVFVSGGTPMRLEARFIHAAADFLYVWCDDDRHDSVGNSFGEYDWFQPFGCDSGSVYEMSVAGLPDGLSFDPDYQTVLGTLSKAGVYYVTISAANANGYTHSYTMRWTVGDVSNGDYDDIGIGTDVFDGMATGMWFEWEGPVEVSVTGLPAGLSRNATTGIISGIPTNPGKCTITFTDSVRQKSVKTAIVRDSGCAYLDVAVAEECRGLGSVSGTGVYPLGTSVRLNAAAAKDAAFMRWDRGDEAYLANARYLMTGYERIEAFFVSAANDHLHVYCDDAWTYAGEYLECLQAFDVDSVSAVSVSVSGLPPGLAFDASSRTFSGTPTKQGTYRVSISASNANGFRTTGVFRWFVGDAETGEFPSNGDYDDIGYDLSAFDSLQTGSWFEWQGAPEVSVSGLPTGLSRNAKTGIVSGTPTKPGLFTITATDANRQKSVRTVRVIDSGTVYVTAAVADDCAGLGTVSGSGLVAAGGGIAVKAVAAKDAAFSGWYLNGSLVSSDATFTYTAQLGNETLAARFIAAANDWLWVNGGDNGFEVGVPFDPYTTADSFFGLDSGSAATLAISGLPTGLTYDAKTKALTGTPTKAGVYYVTASATNANGYAHSVMARWFVGDVQEEPYDNIGLDLSPLDDLYTGQRVEWCLGMVTQCSGLPQGLSYNARTGVVSGMPSKPGKYTFTATDQWRNTAEKTFIVRDNGSAYVTVRTCDGMDDRGTVTGAGVYAIGSAVKLTSAQNGGWYFAGWHTDPGGGDPYVNYGLEEWRDPQMTFTLSAELRNLPFFARFVSAAEDYLDVGCEEQWYLSPYDDGSLPSLDGMFWINSATRPEVTASGLPAGMAISGTRLSVTDASKLKPGSYDVTLSVATPTGLRTSRTVSLEVTFPLLTATASMDDYGLPLGTVTGGGAYWPGTQVALKAVAAPNAAFAGWYREGSLISTETAITYITANCDEYLEARFIAAANDWLWVDGDDNGFEVGVPFDPYTTADWFFGLDSGSAATLALSGLPTGLKYDAKTRALTGTPTKDGVYYVTASAANANGYAHSVTVRWFVGDVQEESYDDIGLELSLFDTLCTGQQIEWYLGMVTQNSGLPQGLSYNARTGVVSGMPSKPGKYTFTATDQWRNTAEKTFIVRDSGSVFVNVRTGDGCEDIGAVSGAGVYPIGSTVKLAATPVKPFCFAGWYNDSNFGGQFSGDAGRDWREPQTEFVLSMERVGMAFFARFIAPEDDYLYLGGSDEWSVWPDDEGGAIFDASWFAVDSATLPNVSAKGLPAGLAMSGGRIVVSDASKLRQGTSTVTLTVSTPSGLSETRTVTLTLEFPVLTVESDVDEFGTPLGTVSGGGAYWAGTQVTLKATSGKDSAFAGWYRNGEDLVSTSATFAYTTASFDEYMLAKFISAAEDWLYVEGMEMGFGVKDQVPSELGAYFVVNTGSEATLAVSGLPTGVKFDAKTLTFSGAPTKAGVYYVTASAKNANGYAHSTTVRWFVGDAQEECYDDIGLDLSGFDELYTGMPFEWDGDKSVSVKGLPAGLSRDSKTGIVSGAPTKPGKYTLTFTDSSRGKAVKTVIVHDSGSAYVDVRAADGDDEFGEASGSGVYAIGSKVKISAKAEKGYYFAGWYLDYGCDEPFYEADGDWRSAGLPVSVFGPTSLFAKFISPDEDYLWIGADNEWNVEMDDEGNLLSDSFWFDLESATAPTVTAKGLPAGMAVSGQRIVVSNQSKLAPGVSKVVLAAKNLTGLTDSAQVTVRVPNLRAEAFASAGLEDMYSFYGGVVGDDMSGVFSSLADDGWKLSVSGLPSGLKYDSKKGVISGTATKAGSFTVYFTATKGKEKQIATATFDVVFPVLELATGAWGDEAASGTVTGDGAYPAGTKVTLKATPAKGSVFAGWYYEDGETPLDGGMDYRTASYTYVTGEEDVSLVALFATAEEDSELHIDIGEDESLYTNEDGSFELDLGARVSSITVPALTVKGLPTGLKFDSKANAISGTTTKPGKYTVTVSATNGSVKKAVTASFTIIVPNIISPYLPGLDPDASAYRLAVGVASPDQLLDLTADEGWTVNAVSGLPAGLKFNSKSGTVSGTPTKSGAYTVTVTAKNGKATTSATVTLNVSALPDWAQGTFTGLATGYNEYGEVHGYVTMTVSAAGKVSGKIASLGGTSISFTAAGFDASSGIGDGDDGWGLFANATAKIGKASVDVPINISRADAPEGLVNAVASISSDVVEARLLRTMWGDKSSAAAAKATMQDLAGVYTARLISDNVSGYLSMTLGADGNLKATGKLPDGTAVSVSTPLVYEDGTFSAVLNVAPKAYKGGDASVVLVFDPDSRAVSSGNGTWSSFDPAATSEYGAGFARSLSAYGAYYDKAAKLSEYYSTLVLQVEAPILEYVMKYTWYDEDARKKVTESLADGAAASEVVAPVLSLDAKGTSFIVPKATKPVQDKETKDWLYAGANDGALTFSFTQATGLFKGTYTFWYDYQSAYDETTQKATLAHTSKKVSFEGVVLLGESLAGFYLWDATGSYEDEKTGKVKTYTYKQTLPVMFEAQ